jgi:hypothetical protein
MESILLSVTEGRVGRGTLGRGVCAMGSPPVSADSVSYQMAATLEARAKLLARRIGGTSSGAIIITPTPGPLRAALEHVLPGVRILALESPSEWAEWDLRLTEVTASVYRVLALDPRLLWDSRLVIALRRWMPCLAGIELAGTGAVGLYEPWPAALLVKRVREVLPTANLALVSVLEGGQGRAWMERQVGTEAAAIDGVLPSGVACRVIQVHTERQRWGNLLDNVSGHDAPCVVVAPSRASAAAAASRLGTAAMPYHGGMLESERGSALEAYRRQTVHVLVTTQLLPPFEDLPAPSTIVLSHPPHRCELVPRLAAWLAQRPGPGPLRILWHASDAAAEGRSGLGVRPNLADLREAYRAARVPARGRYARLTPESLVAAAGPSIGRPYLAATCLAALETAGYLRREDDLARLVSITVLARDLVISAAKALPAWQRGVPLTIDPLAVAMQRDLDPSAWQRELLEAAHDGQLTLRPVGRERLYKLTIPDRGAAARLQAMVRERANVVENERRAVTRWLEGRACRVQALAALLDLPAEPKCGICDRCAPEANERLRATVEPWLVVLRALAEIPLAVPERAAERIAEQALVGWGYTLGRDSSKAVIDLLVTRGLVRREVGDLLSRLAVSEEGLARLTITEKRGNRS